MSVRLSMVWYKLPVINKTSTVRIIVMLKSVLITISAVEKQRVSYFGCVCVCLCVCSIIYPACNAHAPSYFVIFLSVSLYHIFLHHLINFAIFGSKLLNIKYEFVFLYNRV